MSKFKFTLNLAFLLLLGGLGLIGKTQNLNWGVAAAFGTAAICLAIVRIYPFWVCLALIGLATAWMTDSRPLHLLPPLFIGIGLLGALCFSLYYRSDIGQRKGWS